MLTMPRFMVSALVGLTLAAASHGQPLPVGSEFQVNTYTTAAQTFSAVASSSAGEFVVVWQSFGVGLGTTTIQGQRYSSAGTPLAGEFQVNTNNFLDAVAPDVAANAMGDFVVAWTRSVSPSYGGGTRSIQGQRYNSAGTPQGGQFQLNTYTTGARFFPSVAVDGAGNFVVVWQSDGSVGPDTSGYSVQGRRYDSTGTPLGPEFQVNTYTTSDQDRPQIAMDGSGNFLVVWMSEGSAGTDVDATSIQGQRYDNTGTPQGPEFQVNTYTTDLQVLSGSAVAADDAGNFVVIWNGGGYGATIQGQRYDNGGTPLGGEFGVNTSSPGFDAGAAVAADGVGDFVVVWYSYSGLSDTSGRSIQGQRFDSTGAAVGPLFQVNSYTTNNQGDPSIAGDGANHFVVVWQSNGSAGSDTSGSSIQAQRLIALSTTTTSTSSTTTSTAPMALPGRVTIIKPGTLAKFVAKPVAGDTFLLPPAASVAAGGSLRVFDTAATAGDNTFTLPATGWRSLGPAGANGYKYRGAGTIGDPCKIVLVRAKVIKGVCRGTGVTLTPPFTGDVGIALSVGTTTIYCAQFGGDNVRNDATITNRKNAPAPGACP